MQGYIQYSDRDDEQENQNVKGHGSYAEPIESQNQAEESESVHKEAQAKNIFVRNKSGVRQPKTIVFVATVLGLIAGFVISKFWMHESKLMRVIVQGNVLIKTEEIERALSPFIGKKMNDVSLSDIVTRLQTLPYIDRVIATKELPDAIRLRIQERRPVAIAIIGKTLKLIDEAGFVMSKSDGVLEAMRLPLLTGFSKVVYDSLKAISRLDSAESANALNFCNALMETKYAKMLISQVCIASNNRLHVLTADGQTTFIFGNSEHKQRLNNFEIFWKQVVIKKGLKPFEYVDVRFDGKIFAKEHETVNPKRKFQN